jgi:hypothetical protein
MQDSKMRKVPLYFNYVGAQRDLLDRAIASYESIAGDLLDIRVHYANAPRKFSTCLNEILKINDEPYFFAHFDSVLEKRSAVQNILDRERGESTAIVGHCAIVDLLMLVVPAAVRRVGGWDEKFSNSWMDLDLYNRLAGSGLAVDVLHRDAVDGRGVLHLSASSARNDPVMKKVYAASMMDDLESYYERHGSKDDPEYLRLKKHISDVFG